MNLKHLRAALAIQKLGAVTTAADQVFLSQSAVSQAMKSLEQDLGHKIFVRSNVGARATEGGELFLARAGRALVHIQEMEDLVSRSIGRRCALASKITSSQLKALIQVVELHNYSAAASALNISQPSIHKAVKSLEEICNIGLFTRRPNGVDPSWLARKLSVKASLFFAEIDQGRDEIAVHSGLPGGRLRIGALPLSQATIVPTATLEILKLCPDSKVAIVDGPYEELLKYLLNGQIDFIIGALRSPEPSPNIVQERLFSDPLCVVTGSCHPLSRKAGLSAKDLQKFKWVAPRAGTPARDVFEQHFKELGVPLPKQIIECSSQVAIRGLLMSSDYVALLPAKQVALDVKVGTLAISPQKLAGTRRNIGMATRKDWIPTKLQTLFMGIVRDTTARTFRSNLS